ncbi:MAG: PAS domain S-box protein [Bacteroidota bacterium]
MRQSKTALLEEIETLKKENKALQGLFSNLQNPELQWWARYNAEFIITLNRDEQMLSVSPTVISLMGYSLDEFTGKDFHFFIHPLDLPVIRRSLEWVMSEPDSQEVCHVRGRDSLHNWLWLEASIINQINDPEIASLMIVFKVLKLAKDSHGVGSLPKVQYSDLFKAIKDALYVNVLKGDGTFGNFIEINEVSCKMLGYTREEFMEMSIEDIGGRIEEEDIRGVHKKLTEGESVIFESLQRAKNGKLIPVEIHASLFRFENQRGMISLVRDITEKKKAEEERQKAEKHLSIIAENTQDIIWLADENMVFEYVSFSVTRVLGYEVQEITGKSFNSILTQTSRETAGKGMESIINRVQSNSFADPSRARVIQLETIKKDGSLIWIENSFSLIFSDRKELLGFVGVSRDITQRKEAENLLTESEEKFRAITNTAQDAIISIDEYGKVVFWNPSAERLFGFPSEEVLGKNVHELIAPPEYLEAATRGVTGFINSGCGNAIGKTIELTAKRKSGEKFPIELSLSLMKFRGANHAIGIIRDISERKFVEDERKKSEELLKKSEEHYRTLFTTMAQGVVYQDATGNIFLANPAAERMLGLSHDKINGRTSADPVWNTIHEDGSEFPGDTHPAMLALKTGKESTAVMGVFNPRFNKYTWINVSAKAMFRQGEKTPYQVFTTFEDITPIRENLNEIRKANQRLEILRKIDKAIIQSNLKVSDVDEIAMLGITGMIPCDDILLMTFDYPNNEAVFESRLRNGKFSKIENRKFPLNLFDMDTFIQGGTDVRIISGENADSGINRLISERGFHSSIAVPILLDTIVSGLLIILKKESTVFSPVHIQIVEDIASLISLNLNRRELNRRLQQYSTGLEKLVRERTSELQAILKAVPDLLFRLNREGILLGSQSGSRTDLLMPEEQFLGKNIKDVLPPHILESVAKAIEEAFTSMDIASFEYGLEINNESKWYECRIISTSENEALAIIRDISQRKTAERALEWNESLLQKMTSTSPLAFFVVDNRTDAILYFNHQFCEIWGITHLEERMKKGELTNNGIIPDCLPVLKDIPAFAASCEPLQDEFNEVVVEDEIPFKDGRIIRRFSTQIRGEKNEYYGRLYIFEDITQRKTAEQFISIQRDLAAKHSTMIDMDEALSISMEALMQIEGVDCGGIYFLDPVTGSLNLVAHRGLSDEFVSQRSHYEADSIQAKIVKGRGARYINYSVENLPGDTLDSREGILSLAILSIEHEGEILGCINLGSRSADDLFKNVRYSVESLGLQIGGTISRIQAETMLLRSKQNFQALFDTLDDFMFILDAGGNIIRTNPVVNNRLGYKADELLGVNVLQVHPPERREEAGFIVGEMLAGRALFCPVPLITKDGTRIPVETRVVMGKWDDEDVLFGISRDISERMKAEAALKMQSAAFESFAIPIIITDPEGRITWSNTSFLRQSGYSYDEIIGQTPGQLVKSGIQTEDFYKELWAKIKSGKVWSGELMNKRKDGSLFPEELTITPVMDYANNISSFIAIKIDITEKKKPEKDLRESEARWNFALEGSEEGVWDWDIITNNFIVSNQWKRILGYQANEMRGIIKIENNERTHPDDLEQFNSDLQKHLNGESEIYRNEHRILCKDGIYKWILDKGKVVNRDSNGKPLRMIGTHTDISDRKKYEVMLRQGMEKEKEMNQLKSKFISVASHEFRTPLATILATSESLFNYRKKMTETQVDERITKIKDQVGNLNRIIEEVLNLSKLQIKERELEPELFDLSAMILETIEEFRIHSGRDSHLEFHSVPDKIEVYLDKKNIYLVVNNLISNAIKYSEPDKTINVDLKLEKDLLILEVKDQGIGIPEKDLKHLFTPFFRASNSGTVAGTGLGLNIVQESVHRHGGTIQVSSNINEGSLFTIKLPCILKIK